MQHIFAAHVVTSGKTPLPVVDMIALAAVLILGTIFLILWRKGALKSKESVKELKPLTAILFVLLPFLSGISVGAYATVARQLYSLTGGKIGF